MNILCGVKGSYMLFTLQVLVASLGIGPDALGALAHVIITMGGSNISDAQAAPQNHIGIAKVWASTMDIV